MAELLMFLVIDSTDPRTLARGTPEQVEWSAGAARIFKAPTIRPGAVILLVPVLDEGVAPPPADDEG